MSDKRPNVLWIGVDQMRADTPGFMGNDVCLTPNLDALAKQSVVFERAYAPSSQCTPSRASMLTGLYAFAHGMGNNADMYQALAAELPKPEQLLTHRLRDDGYRLGYVGKWHVGKDRGPAAYGFGGMNLPGYGDPKTFPDFRRYLDENGLAYASVLEPRFGNGDKTLIGGVWNGPTASTPERYLTERCASLLEEFAKDERPFFITCQYWAPHPPYLPSPEYAGLHDRSGIEPWINFEDDLVGKPRALQRFRDDFYRTLPDSWVEWRELVGLYYDYTAQVDAEIGRLLGRLDELGLADDTIVVFTSDHGDMNGSHGLFDKGFMYEEAHRVPLVMRWRGRWRPRRRADLASNMDILPTILAANGESVDHLHGAALEPGAGDTDVQQRQDLLLESHGMRNLYSQRALVTAGGEKYIFNPSDEDELYDLGNDPGELHNLLAPASLLPASGESPSPANVDALRRRLVNAMSAVGDPLTEYAAKLFGDWSNRSGQPDASSPF